MYVLTVVASDIAGSANAWWYLKGVEFFGVNAGEACIPVRLNKGDVLTTRSLEGAKYIVRAVF